MLALAANAVEVDSGGGRRSASVREMEKLNENRGRDEGRARHSRRGQDPSERRQVRRGAGEAGTTEHAVLGV